jgi:hypothetical protein
MRVINFKVSVRDNGDIELKLPEGAGQQRDAGTLASFTDKLSKLLGKVKERHVGRTDAQGVHTHEPGHVHNHRH